MTNIKCRYGEWRCYHRCEDYWHNIYDAQCGEQSCCSLFVAENPNERKYNQRCRFEEWHDVEFERAYKRYEYDEDVLTIGSKKIFADSIHYLEIDGRVLIGDEPEQM